MNYTIEVLPSRREVKFSGHRTNYGFFFSGIPFDVRSVTRGLKVRNAGIETVVMSGIAITITRFISDRFCSSLHR